MLQKKEKHLCKQNLYIFLTTVAPLKETLEWLMQFNYYYNIKLHNLQIL